MLSRLVVGFGLCLIGMFSLAMASAPEQKKKDSVDPTKNVNDKRFHKALLKVARNYKGYVLIDGTGRWSPALCRAPVDQTPRGHFSESTDRKTHGRKIYVVYTSSFITRPSYTAKDKPAPVGQALVKEAWKPKVVTKEELQKAQAYEEYRGRVPSAEKEGKIYHATEKESLYIMLKLDPKIEGTDQGWIYGTVSPDGKTVTSSGRVTSCMRCHVRAPYDRRFGLPTLKKNEANKKK